MSQIAIHVKHKSNKHGKYQTNHETIKHESSKQKSYNHTHPNGHNAYACALDLGHTC